MHGPILSPEFIEDLWYGKHPLSLLLVPAGWVYQALMTIRHLGYLAGLLPVKRVAAPVIVVGNLTVGGTGKTPLVIWLANFLRQNNYQPGIVTSGYGGVARHWPQQVRPDSDPDMVGDEAIVIARHTGCPVAAAPDRYAAAAGLLEHNKCNIIICDDGLQHYALDRDLELLVVDALRRYGNRRCLPAGPLRESLRRTRNVDMIICNGHPGRGEYQMEYEAGPVCSLRNEYKHVGLETFKGKNVHAVAGIGHPARYFNMLRVRGLGVIEHEYPDHHRFTPADISFDDGLPVIMTEKDAVKCMQFAGEKHWYLSLVVKMEHAFEHRFSNLLKDVIDGQKAA
ncbi:MAG: tetraacyldisaccharide 4'-kinase [Gammaproteobacteria bacterium]